jgi:CheY-like chemotaxis protein
MKHILVVDDEPHILEGLRHLLKAPDRTIVGVSLAKEALERIAQHIPDLLITDVMMPEMSGLELVAALRADEATCRLPVIILTAKGQALDATMAQEVWGATVMAKPFQPRKLRELVQLTLMPNPCAQSSSI